MGIWQSIKNSVSDAMNAPSQPAYWLAQSATEELSAVKDYDYSQYQPFEIPFLSVKWTDRASYAAKSQALMANSISKACIRMRANGVANIALNVKASQPVKDMLDRPNFREPTLQTALIVAETHLSIAGDIYWFWDTATPGLPQLHVFRSDCVNNNIAEQQYEYDPSGKFTGERKPDFIFQYDHTGKTVSCKKRNGKTYSPYRGALQHVCYFDPRTASEGAGAGDSALRAVDIVSAIDEMVLRKFKHGGTKNGYLQLPGLPSDADRELIVSQLKKLNPDGNLGILPAGMQFQAAQLTFQDMSVGDIRDKATKEICTAFGVPAELVNESVATYANARGKDKIFWMNFIDPESKFLIGQLEAGVRMYVDPTATIEVDETSVRHLEEDRLDGALTMSQMSSFTADEIRATMGYGPVPPGAELVGAKPNMGQPDEKPKGEVAFNANAGNRGDDNNG